MPRINVGCGATPTPGWTNYDNSLCVRLTSKPWAAKLFGALGLLSQQKQEFIAVSRRSGIRWANVAARIPEPHGSVAALYTSHMLDFLTQQQREGFLGEARRVLMTGGIIRVSVADLRQFIDRYLRSGDANTLIRSTGLPLECGASVNTLRQRLGFAMQFVPLGHRLRRQWMFDGESLCGLLKYAGFQDARILPAGETMIRDPGELNLRERESESVFVEAVNP